MKPDLVCFDCGRKHGVKHHNNRTATMHNNLCGVCGRYTVVCSTVEFGGLKDDWTEGRDENEAGKRG